MPKTSDLTDEKKEVETKVDKIAEEPAVAEVVVKATEPEPVKKPVLRKLTWMRWLLDHKIKPKLMKRRNELKLIITNARSHS